MTTTNIKDPAELVTLATQAYLYGYPLVYNLVEISRFLSGPNLVSQTALPRNQFGHARHLLDPSAHFVSPNNDTLYMIAICDVSSGPLVLHVPDTHDRYYVLQFVDAWTNNFAYIGRRATGTAEGRYLLVTADYQGEVPDGMPVVRAPSAIFVIVGRIAVDGERDLPAAHALQDQFTLTPIGKVDGSSFGASGVPQPEPGVGEELQWWEEFRVALAAFPPPEADASFLAICQEFGLTQAQSPYVNPDPELEKILVAAEQVAHAKIEELIQSAAQPINGWQDSKLLFNYNLDHFEIGTLNTPEWKFTDRKVAYVTRAVAARAGLWGNHGYEANYQLIYVDADDQPLTSDRSYELHMPTPPPVDAFWSLTMYNVPEFYLVANPIRRYSIGDRTPGLQVGADGSITIYLQKDSPGPDKESNWLPTPQSGAFRPIMRMYQPKKPILDGSYIMPAIRHIT